MSINLGLKPSPDDEDSGALSMLLAGDLISGSTLPAPIRRNALKAFSQLCAAAIEIPIALLEGVAEEKRAETQARVKIISAGAEQIAAQMSVSPEFAHAAVKKFGQKIIRERINLDNVARLAAQEIQGDSVIQETGRSAPPATAIDDDWLNNFEKEACQKSTEEMQSLFGRILAGEIRRPSSYSIRTVQLMGQLDAPAASLFRRLCSMAISLKLESKILRAKVVSLGGNAGSNSLQRFGLSFNDLNVLHEYGLIIPDFNSWTDYGPCIIRENHVQLPATYQRTSWGFQPTEGQEAGKELRLHGVSLSRAGMELLEVVDVESVTEYTAALVEYLKTQKHLEMIKVSMA
ncbi:MAG: DUF2806 domain-containing protein [Bryobacteraceae bacterium]|nr:DUF2806 domain-containing protein [Bryobacteraceae bacterium]